MGNYKYTFVHRISIRTLLQGWKKARREFFYSIDFLIAALGLKSFFEGVHPVCVCVFEERDREFVSLSLSLSDSACYSTFFFSPAIDFYHEASS